MKYLKVACIVNKLELLLSTWQHTLCLLHSFKSFYICYSFEMSEVLL